jgi:tRNA-specific 2-thiouridylase
MDGNVLGKHKGIHQYTVGQRKGLGIALGVPAFVVKICPENNTVVLGTEDDLLVDTFCCRNVNFQSIPEPSEGDKIRCLAKARYHQTERPATIEMLDNGLVSVKLDEAIKGVSPGQSAVFYDEDGHVVGGGLITVK